MVAKPSLLLIQTFLVKFIRRQANTAAHSLAKAVVAYASPANLHHIPYCILEVINNEII